MRIALLAATAAFVFAGAAHAQYRPYEPPKNPYALPKTQGFQPYKPPEPFKPYTGLSVYDNGPFSPEAEARRARKAAQPPAGGAFSPEGEAKRQRERWKTYHPF